VAQWHEPVYREKEPIGRIKFATKQLAKLSAITLGIVAFFAFLFRGFHGFFFFFFVPVGQWVGYLWRQLRHGKASQSVLNLLDYPSQVPQLPVRVLLSRDDMTIGQDDGVVSFCDGWLHYQGLRTSFSLHRSNVAMFPSANRAAGSHVQLTYDLQGHRQRLTVFPYNEMSDRVAQWDEFQRHFWNWNKTHLDLDGQPVFPPVAADPSYVHRREMGLLALCFVSAILFAPAAATFAGWRGLGWLSPYFIFMVVLLWFGTYRSVKRFKKLASMPTPSELVMDPVDEVLPAATSQEELLPPVQN